MRDGRARLNEQTGLRNILTRVLSALLGLGTAYIGARLLTSDLIDGGTIGVEQLAKEVGIFLGFATLALTITSVAPIRSDLIQIHQLVAENENELRNRSRGQRFLRHVGAAFEMAEREDELYAIAGVAMRSASDTPAEILVADSSNAHIQRVASTEGHHAPGCGVTTPRSCPAVRSGRTLTFSTPNALATCPRLRERELGDEIAAVCVPVNVLGTPSAVLHAVRDTTGATRDELLAEASAMEGVADRFGARLGMMRAMSQSQLQADTDPLTGLLNRRAMENQVREMRTDHARFAVAMADLDHFKDLNDTFGHDTGDRALRLFARVLRSAVRDADIVARHGGEEFVIVLPGADATQSAPVLHRLRERLAGALADAQLPVFTVSLGLVDSTANDDLSELIKLADSALMRAKADGRDRVVIWDPSIAVEPSRHESSEPVGDEASAST